MEETNRLRREADAAAAKANAADVDAQREVAAARQAAIDAENATKAAAKDSVKGLRTVHHYEITDHKAALHDIAVNDREAVTAFIEDYVRRNHRARGIKGVRVWTAKEAF